jgi:hypothetical protein
MAQGQFPQALIEDNTATFTKAHHQPTDRILVDTRKTCRGADRRALYQHVEYLFLALWLENVAHNEAFPLLGAFAIMQV